MRRLIIVGASGLIGREFFALAQRQGWEVIGTYCGRPHPDLTRFDLRSEPLSSVVPDLNANDVVCLLAAYSNPSWIFSHPEEAARLNLTATKGVIAEVHQVGGRLVFISSVEVFDGETGGYDESAPPKPLNLYGRMKHEIEGYLTDLGGRHTIVRTGWNVGWEGEHRCVVALTYETLLRPDARMAQDNTFSLIDVRDTAQGLLRLCDEEGLPICHLASAPPVRRLELAALIKATSRFGEEMAYEAVPFSAIPYSEPRGRSNHLDNRLARERLGLTFREPEAIIREKVAWLDQRRGGHDNFRQKANTGIRK